MPPKKSRPPCVDCRKAANAKDGRCYRCYGPYLADAIRRSLGLLK